jgi:DNA-directed RNA polymerase subunit H (RpoH/RPB5)
MSNSYLLRVKYEQVKMVERRGFDVSTDDYQNRLLTERGKPIRANLSFYYRHKLDNNYILNVTYIDKIEKDNKKMKGARKQTITKPYIQEYVKYLNTWKIDESILIIPLNINKQGTRFLDEFLAGSKIKHQIFLEEELSFDPLEHIDVSEHILLTKEEALNLMAMTKTNITMLPLIKANDPIIKYYGWTKGGIVKIIRHDSSVSVLSEKSINYRVIVA